MTDSKVYIALAHLTVYELNSFRKYLESPYFNVNERLLTLFDIYMPIIRGKSDEGEYTKDLIWEVIYPGASYDDKRYRKMHSELLKIFENFLAQKAYDANKFLQGNLTLEAVRTRKIENLYKSVSASSDRALQHNYNRSSEYLYARYYNEKQKLELYSEAELMRMRGKSIEGIVNIDATVKHLDQFYIAEKLKHYVKLLAWKKLISLDQDLDYIDEVYAMMKNEPVEDIPSIAIYDTIIKTQLDQNDKDSYFSLKQQVEDFIDYFPDDEIGTIYDALLSFAVRMVNKGDLSFQEETLEVYKGALAKETIFENGNISPVNFNNIVFFALRTGNYDWAEQFVDEYQDRLNDKDRTSSVAFSHARIQFYRGDYGKVIELLQEVEMSSVLYTLNSKTILLLSYYELDEFDALDSFVNSFRVYINREKSISTRKKGTYKNLLKYVSKLINMPAGDKNGLKKLREEISETPGVGSKPWLIQKIDEKL